MTNGPLHSPSLPSSNAPEGVSSGSTDCEPLSLAPALQHFWHPSDFMPYAHIVHPNRFKPLWYRLPPSITSSIMLPFMFTSLHLSDFPYMDSASLHLCIVSLYKQCSCIMYLRISIDLVTRRPLSFSSLLSSTPTIKTATPTSCSCH